MQDATTPDTPMRGATRRTLLAAGIAIPVGLQLGFGIAEIPSARAVAGGPLIDPSRGRSLGDPFGARPGIGDGYHGGLDFPGGGFTVYAAADGVVIPSNYDSGAGPNAVQIRHPQLGITTGYAHLASRSVSNNQTVVQGQAIGVSGYAGFVIPSGPQGAHLHFEVIPGVNGAIPNNNGNANYDPMDWIDFNRYPSPNTPSAPEEFLMALSQYDQELIRNAVVDINNRTAALESKVSDIQARLRATNSSGTAYLGFDWLPAINNNLVALSNRVP